MRRREAQVRICQMPPSGAHQKPLGLSVSYLPPRLFFPSSPSSLWNTQHMSDCLKHFLAKELPSGLMA